MAVWEMQGTWWRSPKVWSLLLSSYGMPEVSGTHNWIILCYESKRFEIPQRASGKRQQKQLSFYFWKYKIQRAIIYFNSKKNILRSQRHPGTCNTQWKCCGLIWFKLVICQSLFFICKHVSNGELKKSKMIWWEGPSSNPTKGNPILR